MGNVANEKIKLVVEILSMNGNKYTSNRLVQSLAMCYNETVKKKNIFKGGK